MIDSAATPKKIRDSIEELYNQSLSKNKIFLLIKSKYPDYDSEKLAKEVASLIYEDEKKKYRIPVYLLVLFAVIYLIFNFITTIAFPPQVLPVYSWIVSVLIWVVSILFIIGFLSYKLFYYSTAVSIFSLALLFIAYGWLFYSVNNWLILETIYVISCLLFLVQLRKVLFPSINFWGNVKRDKNGYMF